MKSILTTSICVLLACVSIESYSQTNDTLFVPEINKQVEDSQDISLLGFSDIESRPGSTTITLGGFDIHFGPIRYYDKKHHDRQAKKRSMYRGEIAGLEFSRLFIAKSDYSLYPKAQEDFIDLGNKSLRINWNLFKYHSNKTKRVRIGAALGFTWENYVWYEDMKLIYDKENKLITPEYLTDKNYKKTKFMQFGLHIPINLFVNINKNIYLGAGIYGDWLLKQHNKIKFPKEKSSMHGANPFQFGAQFCFGVRNIYAHGTYSFTKLFEKERGPEINPASIGIGIWF